MCWRSFWSSEPGSSGVSPGNPAPGPSPVPAPAPVPAPLPPTYPPGPGNFTLIFQIQLRFHFILQGQIQLDAPLPQATFYPFFVPFCIFSVICHPSSRLFSFFIWPPLANCCTPPVHAFVLNFLKKKLRILIFHRKCQLL